MFLLFFACEDNTSSYKITGRISSDSMNGQTIYLENYLWYMQLSNQKIVDSTIIQGNGFEFTGKADSSYMAVLTVANNSLARFFVENGNINVKISKNLNESQVSGTKLNDSFKSYLKSIEPVREKINKLIEYVHSQKRTDELDREMGKKYNEFSKEMLQLSIKFLDKNPGNILSAFVLLSAMSQGIDEEIIQRVYDKLEENTKNSTIGNFILKELEKIKIKEITIGEIFRDLTMQTPEGKTISISDYAGKGKYVLLDFWASWCGPCRAENPNVVALYNDYKNKGFEIIGLSMDEDKNAWINGIKDDNITWPQMSDLKGWNSEAALKYKIKGIPFTVLLNTEGKVIATNLRGKELRNKLKTLIP
jgi:thiol-disulfide isomerase/thioredoxin